MISFLGFNANLDDILEKVEKWFGKQVSGHHLQQILSTCSRQKWESEAICWLIGAEIQIFERKVPR